MYDYQKELEQNFRQFQKQLQPMVTTHRKVTHRGKARYDYYRAVLYHSFCCCCLACFTTGRERSWGSPVHAVAVQLVRRIKYRVMTPLYYSSF